MFLHGYSMLSADPACLRFCFISYHYPVTFRFRYVIIASDAVYRRHVTSGL
jgi:hypothetical protein